jgi:hypothetical protein
VFAFIIDERGSNSILYGYSIVLAFHGDMSHPGDNSASSLQPQQPKALSVTNHYQPFNANTHVAAPYAIIDSSPASNAAASHSRYKPRCQICGERGHFPAHCPSLDLSDSSNRPVSASNATKDTVSTADTPQSAMFFCNSRFNTTASQNNHMPRGKYKREYIKNSKYSK